MSTPTRPRTATPTRADDADPVEAFKALVRATAARDYSAATKARKQLRLCGWACAPCGKGVVE